MKILGEIQQKCQKKNCKTHVFTYKSDLPTAEAPGEIFADFPETGKSST